MIEKKEKRSRKRKLGKGSEEMIAKGKCPQKEGEKLNEFRY